MQIYNRGGFSKGYLKGKTGKDMIYDARPNHTGIAIGEVISYKQNRGYVKFKLEESIAVRRHSSNW